MSLVFPLFHAVVTVRIGLKTQSDWEHPFYNMRIPDQCTGPCLTNNREQK